MENILRLTKFNIAGKNWLNREKSDYANQFGADNFFSKDYSIYLLEYVLSGFALPLKLNRLSADRASCLSPRLDFPTRSYLYVAKNSYESPGTFYIACAKRLNQRP